MKLYMNCQLLMTFLNVLNTSGFQIICYSTKKIFYKFQDPWGYINDVYLMFENAWVYNRKTSRVYRYCTKVSVYKFRIILFFMPNPYF